MSIYRTYHYYPGPSILVMLDLWMFCIVLALVYHAFLLHDAMKFEEAMETLQFD